MKLYSHWKNATCSFSFPFFSHVEKSNRNSDYKSVKYKMFSLVVAVQLLSRV